MEKTLIATVGLPSSGKSTWCQQYTNKGPVIVNPDSFRLAIHGQEFVGTAERHVWSSVYTAVRALFIVGHKIVLFDATNITEERRKELWLEVRDVATVKFILFPVCAENCILRAIKANRNAKYLEVINRMAAKANWEIPFDMILENKEVDALIQESYFDGKPLSVEEARKRGVCRICHKTIDKNVEGQPENWHSSFGKRAFPPPAIMLDFGHEFAHVHCLKESEAKPCSDRQ